MLKGQAKKDYQQKYMKDKRSNKTVGLTSVTVDPGLTELGLTIESMMPSERELWDKHGFDCRTPVYNECLRRQEKGKEKASD